MGQCATKSRDVVIDIIPDEDVMIAMVKRIAQFERMLKEGQKLTRPEAIEREAYGRVRKELRQLGA